MKKVLLLTAFFALVSCGYLTGVLHVKHPMELLRKGKAYSYQVGEYKAKIKLQENKHRIVLKIYDEKGDATRFYFKFPEDAELPSENSEFELLSADSGQPHDLYGEIKTKRWSGDLVRDRESCTYERAVTICNQNGCHTEYITEFGYQDVEYYQRFTKTEVSAKLYPPMELNYSNTHNAQFTGKETVVYNDYVYKGRCF